MSWFTFKQPSLYSLSCKTSYIKSNERKKPKQHSLSVYQLNDSNREILSRQSLFLSLIHSSRLSKKSTSSIQPLNVPNDNDNTIVNSGKDTNTEYTHNSYNSVNYYKITQNIRNGCKLTQPEIEYIHHLQRDDLIELIQLYDECMRVYAEMIKSLI